MSPVVQTSLANNHLSEQLARLIAKLNIVSRLLQNCRLAAIKKEFYIIPDYPMILKIDVRGSPD